MGCWLSNKGCWDIGFQVRVDGPLASEQGALVHLLLNKRSGGFGFLQKAARILASE